MINFLQRLLKKKYIFSILSVILLFGILGLMYNTFILNRQKSMVIEFNYPGAEKGLNPDGSIFEISDLKSSDVIERAKENLKTSKIDTEFLQSRIFITSKISGQSLDNIVSAVHREQNLVYMPTTFYVYYSQKNKFSKNESEIFLKNLAKAYSEHFKEKYTEKNDVLIFNPEDYNFWDKDYLEIYTIFKNKVESMYNYITNHHKENRAFYSEDKVNLGMAAKKIESFRDINLEKFYSYIVQNAISKNNSEFSKRTDYLISENNIEYNKSYDACEIANSSIKLYNSSITAVAFIPSVDNKRNFYMSRTETGFDDLTKKAYSSGMDASKTLKDIEYYKSLYSKFASEENTGRHKQQSTDEMIDTLSTDLKKISDEILKTDNEYLEHKTMNYFNIRLPDKSRLNLVLIIKFMILGFILAFIFVIITEFFKGVLLAKVNVLSKALSTMEIVRDRRRK